MFRALGDLVYPVDGAHAPREIACTPPSESVWIRGQLVPRDSLKLFLKSKPCAWRHAFHGGGCE